MMPKGLAVIILIIAVATGVYAYSQLAPGASLHDIVSTPGPLRVPFGRQAGVPLTRAGVLTATNDHRAQHTLPALTENEILHRAAENKVQDILAKQYFEHVSPDGTGPADVVDGVGYKYLRVGENLALGNFPTDAALVQAWMDSPGHRANILSDKFTEIGIAVARGTFEGEETWLAVQTFATPLAACPTPEAAVRQRFEDQQQRLTTLNTSLTAAQEELAQLESQLRSLLNDIKSLTQQAAQKTSEGNREIERGNEIYESTGSEEQAQPYWDRGEELQQEGRALQEQAENKQAQYNALVDQFEAKRVAYNARVDELQQGEEDIQHLQAELNEQIQSFNNCLQ
jgi:uncharacterized protein YkwD/uncharacterized coiled-coil protein SlyX